MGETVVGRGRGSSPSSFLGLSLIPWEAPPLKDLPWPFAPGSQEMAWDDPIVKFTCPGPG
jgi:hypothetical protein